MNNFADADWLGNKYRAKSHKTNLIKKFGNISDYFISFYDDDSTHDSENIGKLMKDLED